MLGELLKKQDVRALRAKNRIVMIVYGLGLLLSPIAVFKLLDAYGLASAIAVVAGIVLSLPVAISSLRKTDEPPDRLIATLLAGIGLPITCLMSWRYLNSLADGQIDLHTYRTWRYALGGPCLALAAVWLYWRELRRLLRRS